MKDEKSMVSKNDKISPEGNPELFEKDFFLKLINYFFFRNLKRH